jgi:hypothetical protein
MLKNFILLLNILLIVKQIEISSTMLSDLNEAKSKFGPKEMLNILERIKVMESLMEAEREEKLIQQEKLRRKIYLDRLVSRIKTSNVLKDFYSGRY